MINHRIAEATRLGYTRILAPTGTNASLDKRASGADIVEVANLSEAIRRTHGVSVTEPTF